jgi:hypothetical protein
MLETTRHRFRRCVGLSVVASLFAVRFVAFGGTLGESLDYQKILRCGPNSLLMFLVLCGHRDMTLKELEGIRVSSDGASMLDLRSTAAKLGVDAEIRCYTLKEIDSINLPAIAQLSTSPSSPTRLHFDVIYKVDAAHLYILNGTTGKPSVMHRSKLHEYWTGYVMTQKVTSYSMILMKGVRLLVLGLVLCDTSLLLLWLRRRRVRYHVPVAATAPVVS